MKKSFQLLTFVLLATFFTLSSCDEYVKGNGNIVKKNFEATDFTAIELEGGYDVFLYQGNSESVDIETDENIMEHIEVSVENNVLKISNKKRIVASTKTEVHIQLKNIEEIDIAGAVNLGGKGTIKSKEMVMDVSGAAEIMMDLDAKEVQLNVAGGSKTELTGDVKKLNISITGAGELITEKLNNKECAIVISGAGSAKVNCTEKLDINITGAGYIGYTGNPEMVNKNITGAGKVENLEAE